MGRFTKRLAVALVGVVAVLGIIAALSQTPWGKTITSGLAGTSGESTGKTTESTGDAVANAAIDASGVKSKLDQALRDRAGDIASAAGVPEAVVDAAIDQLDIESWKVATLPDGATATGSFKTTYRGVDATVTTYDDPGYVTVDADGAALTLAVPASAQTYTKYLKYLS